jgi:hypothetical protein
MINKPTNYHGESDSALAVVGHPLLDEWQGGFLTMANSRWPPARSLEFGRGKIQVSRAAFWYSPIAEIVPISALG